MTSAETTEPLAVEADDGTARVELTGKWAGKWVRYRKRATGREWIAFFRAETDPATALEAVATRVVEHNLNEDGKPSSDSILDLDMALGFAIIMAWNVRDQAAAVDPQNGSASD